MSKHRQPVKILVRAPNWIGDAVMSLPALDALKRLYPGSEITVLTRPLAAAVFMNNPAVAAIIEYDPRAWYKGLLGRLSLIAELARRRFAVAVLFQNAFEAALICFLARIRERVGYATDYRGFLLTKSVAVTDDIKQKHLAYYYLNIIAELGGGPSPEPVPRLYITEDEKRAAYEYLKQKGFDPEARAFIGVFPGASYGPAKRWPVKDFSEVLKRASEELTVVPVIFGGPGDTAVAAELARGLGCEHLNLAGEVDLRNAMALMTYMRTFITNDSGPMHLSASLGVATVAVFGSTDPVVTGPLGPRVKVVYNAVHCSPCFKRTCPEGHWECMDAATIDEVYAAVRGLMEAA